MPAISVIIPAYNCELFIREAITSVQTQSFQDFEIVVVNDGSTDQTLSIVESMAKDDQRIKVLSQSNSGKPSVARNVAIKNSTGEFLCFLDGDDVFLPSKFEKEINLFLKYPQVNVVFHDVRFLNENDNSSVDKVSYLGRVNFTETAKDYITPDQDRVYLCKDNYYNFMSAYFASVLVSAVMIRRSCLLSLTVWFPENIVIGEDIDLWFRLALTNRFAYLDEPLSHYRQHDNSITRDMSIYLKGSIQVHLRNLERGRNLLTEQEKKKYQAKIRALHWHYGYLLYSNYQMSHARREYFSALKLAFSVKAFIALLKTMLPVSLVKICKSYLRA